MNKNTQIAIIVLLVVLCIGAGVMYSKRQAEEKKKADLAEKNKYFSLSIVRCRSF